MSVRTLGYLSGAPRVSTELGAEASGPRAHVLGVIGGFQQNGWNVVPYISGDRFPALRRAGSEKVLTANNFQTGLADIARTALGVIQGHRAKAELVSQVDVVYERFAAFQALGRGFRRHGIPWVLETNGLFFQEAKKDRKSIIFDGLAKRLEIAAYRDCDMLVCVSDALKESVQCASNIDPDKILVVPNGVDTKVFTRQGTTPRRLFPTESVVIGFVGSLIAWQGLDVLLHALARARSQGHADLALAVVGDGPMRDEWTALTRRLGLGAAVHFVGRVPFSDVPAYIAGFDLGFSGHHPTSAATVYHSPLKLYEYLAMGVPVIASQVADVERLRVDGRFGFTFEPGNVQSLCAALTQAANDRAALGRHGARGCAEVHSNHSWAARVSSLAAEMETRFCLPPLMWPNGREISAG